MITRIELTTSQADFDQLHALANTRRGTVKVETQALLHLLIDYSVLLGAVQGRSGFTVIEPTAKPLRQRIRLP